MEIPSTWDVTFFSSPTVDTQDFIYEAAENFAAHHTGYPDGIIVNIWRRISTLPADYWHGFHHGPIHIPLHSPNAVGCPAMFIGHDVENGSAICFRTPHEDTNVSTE